MLDNIVRWLIKKLIFFWDRNDDMYSFCFGRDEHREYSIIVTRYFDDYWMRGGHREKYRKGAEETDG